MAILEGKRLTTVLVTKALAAAAIYHAEDVLSESAAAGTVYTFSDISRVPGGTGFIVKAKALSKTTNVTPRLTLYLFNAAPSTTTNDHAANVAPADADRAFYIGRIDFPALEDLGGDSSALCTPSTLGNLPLSFTCATTTTSLIGILVTRDAFTQTATDNMTISLTAEQY